MSLVTQCPQCALLFKVSAEQLAATQGQVRCGRCAHVLDGQAFAIGLKHHQPETELNTEPQRESAVSAESWLNAPRIDLEVLLRRQDVPAESSAAAHAAESWVAATATPAPLGRSVPPASAMRFSPRAPSAPPLAALPPEVQTASTQPALPVKPGAHMPCVGTARLTDGLLRGGTFLLALSLCFQALVFFKDELVAQIPATRPMLEFLCVPAACALAPLRRWNGIVIQSASLVRGDAVYTLNVSLRNAVDVPLAMTAIELTLTDAQDRAVMRRVLSPKELTAPLELAAGQIWTRAFTVEPGTLTAEVVGYRLVSFYP